MGKTIVFGIVERGGDVITRVVPDVKRVSLEPHIVEFVEPGSKITTDELNSYKSLSKLGYDQNPTR